jgi:IS4 transposase
MIPRYECAPIKILEYYYGRWKIEELETKLKLN